MNKLGTYSVLVSIVSVYFVFQKNQQGTMKGNSLLVFLLSWETVLFSMLIVGNSSWPENCSSKRLVESASELDI